MFYNAGARIFCLDVAHGDHTQVINYVKNFKELGPKDTKLIVGNIATASGAFRLMEAGADAIKIGIGPGAACRTREVTGFGVPQLTAIMNIASIMNGFPHVRLIADGGIKNSGDIVKALAAGADTVMIGSLLAGCDEAPNPGQYYGNASVQLNGHRAPEGIGGYVLKTGSTEDTIKELAWGIRSGLSYGGATNIKELKENAQFIQVTAAGQHESQTRLNEPQMKVYQDTFAVDQLTGRRITLPL
jgi:IMP dehydrogenase